MNDSVMSQKQGKRRQKEAEIRGCKEGAMSSKIQGATNTRKGREVAPPLKAKTTGPLAGRTQPMYELHLFPVVYFIRETAVKARGSTERKDVLGFGKDSLARTGALPSCSFLAFSWAFMAV